MSDELLDRLAGARPQLSADLLEPNHELLEEILMTNVKNSHSGASARGLRRLARRGPHPRRLVLAATAAAAAVVGIAVAAPTGEVKAPVAVNMQTIAESTSAALSSGRAHITYSTNNGHFIHDTGRFVIDFSGENRSTVGTLDPGNPCEDASVSVPQERCESEAFEIANKVVDGKFYLRDGIPGQQTWIEDINEHVTGSDLFSVDPRMLLSGAAQDAAFKDVGAATVDGVKTRHLKATRLHKVPTVNLGLGPISDNETKITKFDVWVDSDNVVRRLDVSTSHTTTSQAGARAIVKKNADGTFTKEIAPDDTTPFVTRTTVNDYSVLFTDIGDPVTIEAPANARKVAGQG